MKKTALFSCFFCGLIPVAFGASQPPQKRIHSAINDSDTFVLKGHLRPSVSNGLAQDAGSAESSQSMPRLSLHLALTAAQQSELNQLLKDQQNRRSPQYRKFLTPEQFASRFGLASADIAKITTWLESNGFSNIQPARSGAWISFSGSVAQAQAAFHTSIHSYMVNGEAHLANATEPQLPKALAGIVSGIGGLDNFPQHPLSVSLLKPRYSANGSNYLVPDDWETIYDVKPLYAAALDGSPISGYTYSIAVVGQSDAQFSDLRAFRTAAGLSAKDPVVIVPPGDNDPGLVAGSADETEADLDLEWAGAIAKNAKIAFVIADTNPHGGVNDALQYAIDQAIAPIVTTSYGECEASLSATQFSNQNALFQLAASQGITVIAGAGDHGAADCDTGTLATHGLSVHYPASSQFVTGIGGTEFNPASGVTYFNSSNNANGGSATSYIPEVAWNDGTKVTNGGQAASGGGASVLVSKPSWQTGTGVPSDGQRDVPDLALTASPLVNPYVICQEGSCSSGFAGSSSSVKVTGGTSAGSPAFAGVVALLVQKTGTPIGLLNSNLYSLATISGNAFHDITGGNNQVNCQANSTGCPNTATTGTGIYGFTAGVGYDQVTGLGSIDANNFVEQWSGDIQLSANPTSVRIPTQDGKSYATPTISVSPFNNFSGSVTFACSVSSNLASKISCSIPNTPVTVPGSAVLTVSEITSGVSVPNRFHFPRIPPTWFGCLLLLPFLFAIRKYRRSLYVWVPALGVLLTLGAVSCGSGSSSGTLSMTCTLPEPVVSVQYLGGNCVASGGKSPYTFDVETVANGGTGALPTGLNLNASTGAITGTPTTAGQYTFTMQVTDSEGTPKTITQNLVLTVQPPLVINGYVTVTATSGAITNTVNVPVTTSF